MTATLSLLGRAALALARRGLSVFPLLPRLKKPRYDGGFHTATCDLAQVRSWWAAHPDDNIGLHPGKSGLIGFDDDSPEAHAVAVGLGLYSEPTLVVATGKGVHVYFRRPDFQVGNLWLGRTLLVRCDDGYTVVPPSIHPDTGHPYRFEVRAAPLPLPPLAVEALRTTTTGRERLGRPAREIPTLAAIPDGQRHETIKTLAGRLVAVTGGRMDRAELWGWLAAFNQARCQPPIDDEQLAGLLDHALGQEGQKRREPRRRLVRVSGPIHPFAAGGTDTR